MILNAPWNLKDLGIYVGLLIAEILAITGVILLGSLLNISPVQVTDMLGITQLWRGLSIFFGYFLQSVMLLTPIVILVYIKKVRNVGESLLLRKVSWYELIVYPIVALILTMVVLSVFNFITLSQGIEVPGVHGEKTEMIAYFGRDILSLVLAFAAGVGLAPFTEEVLFRGFIFHTLTRYMKPWLAIAISSAIFAAFHLKAGVFFPLMFLGAVLTTLTWRTQSIWPAIVFHIINNSLAFVAEYSQLMS